MAIYTNQYEDIELIKEWFGVYISDKNINPSIISSLVERITNIKNLLQKAKSTKEKGKVVYELEFIMEEFRSLGGQKSILIPDNCRASELVDSLKVYISELIFLFPEHNLFAKPCGQDNGDDEKIFQELIDYFEIKNPKICWVMENYIKKEVWSGDVDNISDITKYYNANRKVNFLDDAGICMCYGVRIDDIGNFYEVCTMQELSVTNY